MENFDIEAMKKKYSEESPEEKEKRTKMEMFPAVINICVGIAMVVVGALNDDKCNGDKDATYFLKVSASLSCKYLWDDNSGIGEIRLG